jgi:Tfp pilus assembly protein PilF
MEMGVSHFPTHRWLSMAYLAKSMPELALQEAQKAAALSNNSTQAMADIAISYAGSGNTKNAMSILRDLEASSKSRYISNFEIAAIFANLHDTDHAFKFLQKAYDERNYDLPYLRVDSRFDSLRSDPRYTDLLHRMGLPQ